MTAKEKSRKVLYIHQNVPDNHVDDSFLVDLKKNLNTTNYSYWPSVIEAGVITQQLCSVSLFLVIFVYMNEGSIHPYSLFSVSSVLTLLGYMCNDCLYDKKEQHNYVHRRSRLDDLKSCLLFLTFGFGLSPLLMTLTVTISTDTIYAMTVFMLLANLMFHDYLNSYEGLYQPVSLNAAIFASVCLASRLPTTWHTFATVTLAVEVFALWPVLRKKIKERSLYGQIAMTVILNLSTVVAVFSTSLVGSVLISALILFITFGCPFLLMKLQPYKNNIYGPWDEAVPE